MNLFRLFLLLLLLPFQPHETIQLGRGRIINASWNAASTQLAVNSTSGAWVYTDRLETITHLANIRLATFNPVSPLLAGVTSQNEILIWNEDFTRPILRLTHPTDDIMFLAWSPDGRWLASLDDIGQLAVWNSTTGILYFEAATGYTTSPYFAALYPMVWSPNSALLAMNTDSGLRIWDRAAQNFITILDTEGAITWIDNYQVIISSDNDDGFLVANLWEVSRGTRLLRYSLGGLDLDLSYDHRLAASAWETVAIADARTGERMPELTSGRDIVTAIAWKPNSTWLALGEGSFEANALGTIRIIDVATGGVVRFLGGHIGSIQPNSMVWSPDGEKLVSIGWRYSELMVWDVTGGYRLAALFEHSLGHTPIIWSPDGQLVLTGDAGGTLHIWDGETGVPEGELSGLNSPITLIEWQPNGHLLAAAEGTSSYTYNRGRLLENSVYIWDMETQTPVTTFVSDYIIIGMVWNSSGTDLAIINNHHDVWIWNIDTQQWRFLGVTLDTWTNVTGIGWDYEGGGITISFSGNGNGGSVSYWNAQTGKPYWNPTRYSTYVSINTNYQTTQHWSSPSLVE
jgi:WD40 repeat protein